jgi:hypothetical protein
VRELGLEITTILCTNCEDCRDMLEQRFGGPLVLLRTMAKKPEEVTLPRIRRDDVRGVWTPHE